VIALIHSLEASLNFTTHLHNGDPLTARTIHVPKGHPKTGTPPFKWEDSALDALSLAGFDEHTDWSLPGILFAFEAYNGWGYRQYHPSVLSPYLWSYSNHYTKGKYVADGHFDPDVKSDQCGAAVLLKYLTSVGDIDFEDAKLVIYRKGAGDNPVAVIKAKVQNGVSYASHNAIAEAIGDAPITPDLLVPIRSYLSGRFTIAWNADTHRIYAAEI
jgi:lysozyme family protein